jgi:hypothetical protein
MRVKELGSTYDKTLVQAEFVFYASPSDLSAQSNRLRYIAPQLIVAWGLA